MEYTELIEEVKENEVNMAAEANGPPNNLAVEFEERYLSPSKQSTSDLFSHAPAVSNELETIPEEEFKEEEGP